MAFKKFRFNIIIRGIIILLLFACLFVSVHRIEWYITSALIGILIISAFIELIRYVEKTNRQLASFLSNIKNRDFSGSIGMIKGHTFGELNEIQNEIMDEFKDIKVEKEVHYQYLQVILSQIDIAIVCFNEKGEIKFSNKAASNFFPKHIKGIDDFKKLNLELYQIITELKPSENKIIGLRSSDSVAQLLVSCSLFKVEKEEFKLFSFKNIKEELDNKELDAWQMLIRILSHEIMNSTTPIVSLTEAISDILFVEGERVPLPNIDKEDSNEIYNGIEVIARKSRDIQSFVQAYKDLTRIPFPKFELFSVKGFCENIQNLFVNEFKGRGICFQISMQSDFQLKADKLQLEQVIVNLIRNAMDAVEAIDNPQISISVKRMERVFFEVKNNGNEIEEEFLRKIFIPFYTTKPKGSGIGLSVCRQIVRLHGGQITVDSNDNYTSFTIIL